MKKKLINMQKYDTCHKDYTNEILILCKQFRFL